MVAIAPQYTNPKCSSCGDTDKKSRVSQVKSCCVSCDHNENAAKNILAAGYGVLAGGAELLARLRNLNHSLASVVGSLVSLERGGCQINKKDTVPYQTVLAIAAKKQGKTSLFLEKLLEKF